MKTTRELLDLANVLTCSEIEMELNILGNIKSDDRTPNQTQKLSELFCMHCFKVSLCQADSVEIMAKFDIEPINISIPDIGFYYPPSKKNKEALELHFKETNTGG